MFYVILLNWLFNFEKHKAYYVHRHTLDAEKCLGLLLLCCGGTIPLSVGAAGSSGIRGVLHKAGDDAEGGTGGEGVPGEGDGAGEEGAAGPAQRAWAATWQTEEDRAAAPRRPARGRGTR